MGCAYVLPRDLVKIQILIQSVWGEAWESTLPAGSQLIPLLPAFRYNIQPLRVLGSGNREHGEKEMIKTPNQRKVPSGEWTSPERMGSLSTMNEKRPTQWYIPVKFQNQGGKKFSLEITGCLQSRENNTGIIHFISNAEAQISTVFSGKATLNLEFYIPSQTITPMSWWEAQLTRQESYRFSFSYPLPNSLLAEWQSEIQ